MPPERRLAWVTGAAGGIGRATVARLAADGYIVRATDIARPAGGQDDAAWTPLDATDEAAIAAFVATLGSDAALDCVVHLAGRAGGGRLDETRLDDWRELVEVNLTSAFLVARAAYPLLRRTRGCLVLMSSSNALNGGSALSGPAYAAAKAGVVNLGRYLAKEWARDGIRVNCVAPGPVDTPMLARLDQATVAGLVAATPLGRVATAADVAATIAFLCSPDATMLTGTLHNVSGGLVLD